jgi:TP901 family phage tail tape measure protein
MPTEAGKAVVPFVADTTALTKGVASTFANLGSTIQGSVKKWGFDIAAATAGAAVIDLAAKFQKSTDQIAANARTSVQEAAKIGAAFLATGGQTTFTATEIAAAFAPVVGQLAVTAGRALNVRESMQFMDAAMAAAEATGQPLKDTVAALAAVMQAYRIQTSGAASTSDVLFNVSRALNIPIGDLVTGFDRLHARLGANAPSLADTGALLEALAQHGLTGSRAIVGVASGLTTLLGNSKPVNTELQKLGVNVYDSSGKFIGLDAVIAKLQPKLADMTDKQRNLALTQLFGKQAAGALGDVILAGVGAFDQQAAAVAKAGSTQDAAKTATDNLKGSFDRIKSSVVDSAIQLGETWLPRVEGAATFVSQHLNVFEDLALALGSLYAARRVGGFIGGIIDDLKSVTGLAGKLFGLGGGKGTAGLVQNVFVVGGHLDNLPGGGPSVPVAPVAAGAGLGAGEVAAAAAAPLAAAGFIAAGAIDALINHERDTVNELNSNISYNLKLAATHSADYSAEWNALRSNIHGNRGFITSGVNELVAALQQSGLSWADARQDALLIERAYKAHLIKSEPDLAAVTQFIEEFKATSGGLPPTMDQIKADLLVTHNATMLAGKSGQAFSDSVAALAKQSGASINDIISDYTLTASFTAQMAAQIGRLVGAIRNAADVAGRLPAALSGAIQRGVSGQGGGGGYSFQHGGLIVEHVIGYGLRSGKPYTFHPPEIVSPVGSSSSAGAAMARGVVINNEVSIVVHGLTADDVVPRIREELDRSHEEILRLMGTY